MDRRPELRVSDRDRQAAADRLLAALQEGRLDLLEYDNRLARAYSAVTYADLDQLFTDLPAPAAAPAPPVSVRAVPAAPVVTASMPLALKILWTIWLTGVLVNLAVWLLVSLGTAHVLYFWPIWLAIPGVALFGVTLGVSLMRGPEPAERRAARDAYQAQSRLARVQRREAYAHRRAAYDQRRAAYEQRRAVRRRYR